MASLVRDPFVDPEDWRILRTLAVYRLALIALLLAVHFLELSAWFFDHSEPSNFFRIVAAYALPALLLLIATYQRFPSSGMQAHLAFFVDALAILLLMYAAHGASSGLGVLLITPAVGCSLVLPLRLGLLHAALATFAVFGAEFLRQSMNRIEGADLTNAGLIGLMLFVTSLGAGAVAARARKSEALAARFGSDLASLSRINERIVESMDTAVLVIDEERRLRLQNAASRRLLARSDGDSDSSQSIDGQSLISAAPILAQALYRWQEAPNLDPEPIALSPGGADLLPRFTRLGQNAWAPVLVLLEDAARVREQAQQLKLAALGRLSAGIAHEIRNPLSAIRHAGQLLAESPALPEQDRRLLDMIQRHTVRIDKIVEDVLRLSRRDAAVPQNLLLRSFLERCIATWAEGCPDGARAIRIDSIPEHLSVRFDPDQLQQVLHNLWQNSFEHGALETGEGADNAETVAINVRLSAGRLSPGQRPYLDIIDDGRGIPAEVREQLFEPFFTTARRGTGLGLYLSREICEYNQARLSHVPRSPGTRGTQFRLVFAASEAPLTPVPTRS
ncbi:ATP-binding protein [Nevskia sp.]|uniref:sensor histidine kinase n=1 Tax=Nevskia sp. TaxID=1929292 RepID=UPI0025FD7772|nr:ATP-binding protein [Nevskia sp.]